MNDVPETRNVDEPVAASLAAADVPVAAQKVSESESLWEIAKTIIYALLIALVIRTFLFQPFNIPSASMEDTLMVGDYLFVEKFAYGYSYHSFPWNAWPVGQYFPGQIFHREPARGDVIVFKMPNVNSPDYMVDFIKRVIGLPGDRIQMIGGVLYINSKPVPKVRVDDGVASCPDGLTRKVPQYRETLPNGKSYLTMDCMPDGPSDNTEVFIVPPGHYFMMGDNRDNSDDSRAEVGYVPAEDLEGKAEFRFFSVDGSAQWWEFWKWPWAIRYGRMFTLID